MISYEVFGHGESLVLLHGWGFDKNIWRPLLPKLSIDDSLDFNKLSINNLRTVDNPLAEALDPEVILTNSFEANLSRSCEKIAGRREIICQQTIKKDFFKLYLVDLPGFGNTPNMSWENFKRELLAILPSTFNVLGWSLGGLFATRLCIEEPHRVLKFINVASTPRFINAEDWVGIDENILHNFYTQFKSSPQQTRLSFINSQLVTNNIYKLVLSNQLNIDGLTNGLEILSTWDLRAGLHSVKNPGLYVFGKLDRIVSRKLMPLLETKYPSFRYIMFKKSAHIPFLSDLDEFIMIIKSFLRSSK